jgi:hypothetical protein
VSRNINTVEKTADGLKLVTQESHRLKSVVRALADFQPALVSRAIGGSSLADQKQRWSALRGLAAMREE